MGRILRAAAVLALLLGASAPAWAAPTAAIVDLTFEGEVKEYMRQAVFDKLAAGLAATGLEVLPRDKVETTLGTGGGACETDECRRKVAGSLGCNYLVGGTVSQVDRTYTIDIWIGRGPTGEIAARIKEVCDICGKAKVEEKVDLAASALRSKIDDSAAQLALVRVTTDPAGATIELDGDEMGVSPQTLSLPAGTHKLTATMDSYYPSVLEVNAVSGVEESVTLKLIPQPESTTLRMAGWVGVGGGVAALAAGIAMLALHNKGVDCDPAAEAVPGGVACARQYNTATLGGILTGIGVAATVVGGYLLWRSYADAEEVEAEAGPAPATPVDAGEGVATPVTELKTEMETVPGKVEAETSDSPAAEEAETAATTKAGADAAPAEETEMANKDKKADKKDKKADKKADKKKDKKADKKKDKKADKKADKKKDKKADKKGKKGKKAKKG